MAAKGIDCAAPLTEAKACALRALGYEFAGRYLVPARGTLKYKALTKAEARAICAADMRLLCVWETTADRAKGGAAAGASDGKEAFKLACELGIPFKAIIYFAVDFDAQRADYDAIAEYIGAVRKNLFPYGVGVYGHYGVIEEMYRRGMCDGGWQCVAWSYGRRSEHLSVYQATGQTEIAGHAVDINECPDMDAAGLWSYEEDDMTGEEIYKRLQAYLAKQPLPDWAKDEFDEAVSMGITDGTRPLELVPRYQAAIMAKRAAVGK